MIIKNSRGGSPSGNMSNDTVATDTSEPEVVHLSSDDSDENKDEQGRPSPRITDKGVGKRELSMRKRKDVNSFSEADVPTGNEVSKSIEQSIGPSQSSNTQQLTASTARPARVIRRTFKARDQSSVDFRFPVSPSSTSDAETSTEAPDEAFADAVDSSANSTTANDNYDLLKHRELRDKLFQRRIKLVRGKDSNNTIQELIRLLRADDAAQRVASPASGSEASTSDIIRNTTSHTPSRSGRPKKKSRVASDGEAEQDISSAYVPGTAAARETWKKIEQTVHHPDKGGHSAPTSRVLKAAAEWAKKHGGL